MGGGVSCSAHSNDIAGGNNAAYHHQNNRRASSSAADANASSVAPSSSSYPSLQHQQALCAADIPQASALPWRNGTLRESSINNNGSRQQHQQAHQRTGASSCAVLGAQHDNDAAAAVSVSHSVPSSFSFVQLATAFPPRWRRGGISRQRRQQQPAKAKKTIDAADASREKNGRSKPMILRPEFLARAESNFTIPERNIALERRCEISIQKQRQVDEYLHQLDNNAARQHKSEAQHVVFIDTFSGCVVHHGPLSSSPFLTLPSCWKRPAVSSSSSSSHSSSSPSSRLRRPLDELPLPVQRVVAAVLPSYSNNHISGSSSIKICLVQPATPWRTGDAASWFSLVYDAAASAAAIGATTVIPHEQERAIVSCLQSDASLVHLREAATGQTALHIAVRHGATGLVRLLLLHGADIAAREATHCRTALHLAAERAETHEQTVICLLNELDKIKNMTVMASSTFNNSSSSSSTSFSPETIIIDARDALGHTPLTLCLEEAVRRNGSLSSLVMPFPNDRDKGSDAFLYHQIHQSGRRSRAKCVLSVAKMFVAHGASVDALCCGQQIGLSCAEMLRLLQEDKQRCPAVPFNAKVGYVSNALQITPLHQLLMRKEDRARDVEALLCAALQQQQPDDEKSNHHHPHIHLLGAQGIATESQNGENAVEMAVRRGHVQSLDLLIEFELARLAEEKQQQFVDGAAAAAAVSTSSSFSSSICVPLLTRRDTRGRNIFHHALHCRRSAATVLPHLLLCGGEMRPLNDNRVKRRMLTESDHDGVTPLELSVNRALRLSDATLQDLVLLCGGLWRLKVPLLCRVVQLSILHGRFNLQHWIISELTSAMVMHSTITSTSTSSLIQQLFLLSSSSSSSSSSRAENAGDGDGAKSSASLLGDIVSRALIAASATCPSNNKSIHSHVNNPHNHDINPGERRKLNNGDASFMALLQHQHQPQPPATAAASQPHQQQQQHLQHWFGAAILLPQGLRSQASLIALERCFAGIVMERTQALGSDAAAQFAMRGLSSSSPETAALIRRWILGPLPAELLLLPHSFLSSSSSLSAAATPLEVAFAKLPLWAVWWQFSPVEFASAADGADINRRGGLRHDAAAAAAAAGGVGGSNNRRSPRVAHNFLRFVFATSSVALSTRERISVCLSICFFFLFCAPRRCVTEMQLVDFALGVLSRDLRMLYRTAHEEALHDEGVAAAAVSAVSRASVLPCFLEAMKPTSLGRRGRTTSNSDCNHHQHKLLLSGRPQGPWLPATYSQSFERRAATIIDEFSAPVHSPSCASSSSRLSEDPLLDEKQQPPPFQYQQPFLPLDPFLPLLPHLARCYPRLFATRVISRVHWAAVPTAVRAELLCAVEPATAGIIKLIAKEHAKQHQQQMMNKPDNEASSSSSLWNWDVLVLAATTGWIPAAGEHLFPTQEAIGAATLASLSSLPPLTDLEDVALRINTISDDDDKNAAEIVRQTLNVRLAAFIRRILFCSPTQQRHHLHPLTRALFDYFAVDTALAERVPDLLTAVAQLAAQLLPFSDLLPCQERQQQQQQQRERKKEGFVLMPRGSGEEEEVQWAVLQRLVINAAATGMHYYCHHQQQQAEEALRSWNAQVASTGILRRVVLLAAVKSASGGANNNNNNNSSSVFDDFLMSEVVSGGKHRKGNNNNNNDASLPSQISKCLFGAAAASSLALILECLAAGAAIPTSLFQLQQEQQQQQNDRAAATDKGTAIALSSPPPTAAAATAVEFVLQWLMSCSEFHARRGSLSQQWRSLGQQFASLATRIKGMTSASSSVSSSSPSSHFVNSGQPAMMRIPRPPSAELPLLSASAAAAAKEGAAARPPRLALRVLENRA